MSEDAIAAARESFVSEGLELRFSSPLFAALSKSCACDRDFLELGSSVRPGQPIARLILLASHFLVLRSPGAPCAHYFASVVNEPRPVNEAFPAFRAFCIDHRDELISILSTRTVNTTLVDRASYILPILQHVAQTAGEPLSIIEIGCSVGLNLLFDRYRYDYGSGTLIGDPTSDISINCTILGGQPPLRRDLPLIARRVGVDLIEVDCANAVERLWMEAMLFPEWAEERRRLRCALAYRAANSLEIVIGDALHVLPGLMDSMPGPICVLHSHSLGQWSDAARLALHDQFRAQSRYRTIHRVGVEASGEQPPHRIRERLTKIARAGIPIAKRSLPCAVLHTVYEQCAAVERVVGEVDGLGSWIDWYD